MSDNINIVQIASYYPPHLGGLEFVAQATAEHLAFNGHSVTVLTSNINARHFPKVERRSNLLIKRLWSFEFAHTAFIPGLLWQLLKVKKPAIFHLHLAQVFTPELIWIVSKLRGIPYVVHFHIDGEPSGKLGFIYIWWKRWIQPLIIKNSAMVITLSPDQTRLIQERYRKPSDEVVFIGNGVGDQFLEIGKVERKFHTPLRLLFVGRLAIQKRPERLIEAMSLVKSNVTLDIVGDGEDQVRLKKLIAKLGIKNVKFHGILRGKELLEAYRNADVFILPSDVEGMPLVLLEAMAAGLPIIGSDVLGITELIKDVGILVKDPNPGTFAEAIDDLANNPVRLQKLSIASARKAQEYSWTKLVRRLEDVYSDVIKKQNKTIAHITPYYPPHTGGIERVAKISAEELAKRRYSVRVITSASSGTKRGVEYKNDLQVTALWSFEFAHTPIAPSLLWHLLALPRNSLIHLHLAQAYCPEIVLLVSKLRSIPYIVHFHLDVEPSGFFGPIFVIYKKLVWGPVLRNARKVIACSPDQVEIIHNKFGVPKENIVVVLNAVSSDFFSDRVYTLPAGQPRLLYIGRLASQKRVERIIETMANLKIQAHLTIVGDGEDREKLETLAKDLNLNNVSFEGKKNDIEMQKYQRENDIFIISSDKEGTALVVLEAMAGGLPIIGSNVSGIRDLLQGVGILVDEPYPENFAKAIEKLWNEPKKLIQLSKQSVEKAKQYSWKRFIDQLEAVYKEIL